MTLDFQTKVVLSGIFETYRQQVVATKLNPSTENMYTDSFAYAILSRVCPAYDHHPKDLLQENTTEALTEEYPFEQIYKIQRESVIEIAEMLDEAWRSKKEITFYDVETIYFKRPWKGSHVRIDLIDICRYLFLSNMFDSAFWTHFMSSAPAEAHGLTDEWDADDLYDID
jgi:hypothetical protein